ncbi:MAG: hypothetical protein Q7L07_08090 [Pseudohongiella sp.]|nr:hypothetical protein [Pseudohongiella sp.]
MNTNLQNLGNNTPTGAAAFVDHDYLAGLTRMDRHLVSAQRLAWLIMQVIDDGHEDVDQDSDPFCCYEEAASALNAAYEISDSTMATFHDDSYGRDYELRLLYVRDLLRLLVTKVGCTDFDRVSLSTMAYESLLDLRAKLANYVALIEQHS